MGEPRSGEVHFDDVKAGRFFVVVPKKEHRPKTGTSGVLGIVYATHDQAMMGLAKRTSPPDEWHVIEVWAWRERPSDSGCPDRSSTVK